MYKLPIFPDFRKVTIEDQNWYNSIFKTYDEAYADFTFGNLMIWLNQHNDLKATTFDDSLILKFTNFFMADTPTTTFVCSQNPELVIDKLFHYQISIGQQPELSIIPDIVINNLTKPHPYEVIEDPQNHEYIYEADDWAILAGSKMRKLRREVTTFEKRIAPGRFALKSLDLRQQKNIESILEALQGWEKTYSANDYDRHEAKVLDTTISYLDRLDYGNICLFVDGKMEGFALYQKTPQSHSVILNHVKVSYNYRYMFDFLLHSLAQQLVAEGVKYVNFEQDLGIPGLRTHKESLKPVRLLKKYTIRPRHL